MFGRVGFKVSSQFKKIVYLIIIRKRFITGMFSGLASAGLHEAFKNTLDRGDK